MAVDRKLILALMLLALLIITEVDASNVPLKVIPSSEVLDRIKLGLPIEYDHVIIKGNLNLHGLDLPIRKVGRTPLELSLGILENATQVNSSIRINDSTIDGGLELSNSIFQKFVNFENTSFSGTVDFKGSQFRGSATFRGAWFSKFVDFRGAKFEGFVDLSGAKFSQSVDFSGADLGNKALFSDFRFNQTADIVKSRLREFVNFVEFRLNETASFVALQLGGFADFSRFKFNETINFLVPQLEGFISFISSEFTDTINLAIPLWNGFVNFIGFEFDRTINFIIPQLRGFASYVRLKFSETVIFATEILSRSGTWLEALMACSAISIVLFGIFWRAIGLRPREMLKDKYGYSEGEFHSRYSLRTSIKNEFLLLTNAIIFSAKVFLSGIKLFIDTPKTPDVIGRSRLLVKGFFNLERVIGALFLILFFVAISRV